MNEIANEARWSWRPTVFVAGVELLLLLLLAIFQQDILFPLASAFVALVLLVSNIVVLIYAAIRKRLRQLPPTLVTLAILWVIPMALLFYERAYPFRLRETARWMAFSRGYKAEVFALRNSGSGDLKHIEWDGAGFAGVANQTVVLAFDPANTLSAVAKSHRGKFNGVSCEVHRVYRLEDHWYAVLFFADETWGDCPFSHF
jgi:amino acid transporter